MASYLNVEVLSMTLWLVRGGRHGEREKYAFENNLVVIGWESLPDLSRLQTKEELRTLYEETYPDQNENKVSNHVGQIWAFVKKIKKDDLVAMPLKYQSAIAIGKITGDYQFKPDMPPDRQHVRPVEWIQTDLPRTAFEQDLLYSLGAYMTVCRISRNNAEQRVHAILEGKTR